MPNQMHVANGLACIERKVPIIVEKPISDTIESAMRLVAASERAGVAVLIGHHRRHNPIMRRAIEIIRDGGVGRVVAANACGSATSPKAIMTSPGAREPGGGPVLINAIHDIDCLRMLCGDVETVQATASNAVRGFAVEDTAAAVMPLQERRARHAAGVRRGLGALELGMDLAENPYYPYRARQLLLRRRNARIAHRAVARAPLARGRQAELGLAADRAARAGQAGRSPITSRCAISPASSAAASSRSSTAATAPRHSPPRLRSRSRQRPVCRSTSMI